MPFKTKTKIKKREQHISRTTLDMKHKQTINKFKNQETEKLKIENEIKILEKKLKNFKNNYELNNDEIEIKMGLKDRIKELKKTCEEIDENNEINYYLNTGDLLFNYYDNQNIDSNKQLISVTDFFKTKTNIKTNNSKLDIYNNYLQKTEDKHYKSINKQSVDYCENCNIEKKIFLSEGKMICNKCGDETFILIDSDKPSFKDPPREICYFAYKRINHFNEWLAQFQAKESTDIPKEIYNEIINELKKERLTDISLLTQHKLREILKKLKKNKYYEHIPHIINKLNGIPPPIMSQEIEEELRRMFKEIQIPFHKHCPKDRKNFLSYSYVLHKFVQLLELDKFISCFLLLKSREKLHQQDQIWKKICSDLKWQFIPSI
jgi:hypothetical protein